MFTEKRLCMSIESKYPILSSSTKPFSLLFFIQIRTPFIEASMVGTENFTFSWFLLKAPLISISPKSMMFIVLTGCLGEPHGRQLHLHLMNHFNFIFQILYVYREPKDAAISYFHHYRLFNDYVGSLDDFLEAFIQDKRKKK